MKCYKIVFQKKYILKNIGFFIFAFLILLDLLLLLYFITKDYKVLIKEIYKIKFFYLNNNINKINNIETNNINRNKKIKKKLNTNIKKSYKKLNINNKQSNLRKLNNKIKSIIKEKNYKRSYKSNNPFNITNTIKLNKKYYLYIKNNPFFKLNNNELNDLPFKDALIKDKRNCIQYYISLLKTKHSVFYIFYTKDYNSKIIKVSIQIFDLATLISVNALFFI